MVKNVPVNAGDKGSLPGSGRSPEERNVYPLQHSYMENPMDSGAWAADLGGEGGGRWWLQSMGLLRVRHS